MMLGSSEPHIFSAGVFNGDFHPMGSQFVKKHPKKRTTGCACEQEYHLGIGLKGHNKPLAAFTIHLHSHKHGIDAGARSLLMFFG